MEEERIIFDMTDLVSFFAAYTNPTGIQRTQIDLFLKMRSAGVNVVPVFFSRVYNCYCLIDPERLFAADRRYLRRIEGRIGRPLKRLRVAIRLFTKRVALKPGDKVFVAGAGWASTRRNQMLAAAAGSGVGATWLCYDLIPVRHPEFSANPGYEYRAFKQWIDQAIRDKGCFICISQFVADDLRAYAGEMGLEVDARVVPLAHEFRTSEAPPDPSLVSGTVGQLLHERFVLYVGAVTFRKNQFALVKVWEKLQRDLGDALPTLVLVGTSWGMDRLFRVLQANGYLGGKLLHFDNASDDDVAFLYRHCEFTVYPSLYEGWGLPVGESLWMGKRCVSSNATSVPEVGGDHVDYFDPRLPGDMEEKLRAALNGEFKATVPGRDKLRTWADVGRDMIAIVRETR